jgi:hypothetical protein
MSDKNTNNRHAALTQLLAIYMHGTHLMDVNSEL